MNKPVVKVLTQTNAETVENGQDRSHNPGKDLGSRGDAEAESPNWQGLPKATIASTCDCPVDGDLQVCFLQIDGNQPDALTD